MRFSIAAATLASHTLLAAAALAQQAPHASVASVASAPAPLAVPALSTAPTAPTAPAAERLVRVELPTIGRHAMLEAYDPTIAEGESNDASWRPLCPSPCAVSVPVGTRLRVNGYFRESPMFLAQDRPTMRLVVDPARTGVRLLGITIAAGGAGIVLLSAYIAANLPPDRGGDDRRYVSRSDMLGTGIVGAVSLGVGVALAAWHWQTRVMVAGTGSPGLPIAKGVWWTASGVQF